MNAPVYTTDILRLAASLKPPHVLERIDGSADLRAPTCGSTIAIDVMLDGGRIAALSQRASACAFGQASAALVEQSAIGRNRAEIDGAMHELAGWLSGTRDDPGHWPGLDALGPARTKTARHGAILLSFRALLAALDAAQ